MNDTTRNYYANRDKSLLDTYAEQLIEEAHRLHNNDDTEYDFTALDTNTESGMALAIDDAVTGVYFFENYYECADIVSDCIRRNFIFADEVKNFDSWQAVANWIVPKRAKELAGCTPDTPEN